MSATFNSQKSYLLNPIQLNSVLKNLKEDNFTVIGPVVGDHSISYSKIDSINDLPQGYSAEQTPGKFTLKKTGDQRFFSFSVGVQSLKKFLYPSECKLFGVSKTKGNLSITVSNDTIEKIAVIGVRSCEIAALESYDKVLYSDRYKDPHYSAKRKNLFIIAVNCIEPSESCFCDSMKTGPLVTHGYDLLLTEFMAGVEHWFLLNIGTEKGLKSLKGITVEDADNKLSEMVIRQLDEVPSKMKIKVNTENLKQNLQNNPDHGFWDEVSEKCLLCGNCTLVCPTCFCTTIEDTTDLSGDHAERWRKWDSCFSGEFSYIHGGSIRLSPKSRYRQWMTHKLSNWVDQFGTFGCVGCGRCTTWCPVGIDIREQANNINNKVKNIIGESV